MTWFKVDDGLHSHPKAMRAGTAALGLWVRAGSWSADQLTDGFVPFDVARMYGTPRMAKALVAAGLWENAEGGFRFHQWNDDGRQPTREQVLAERAATAERVARLRKRRNGHHTDDVTADVTPLLTGGSNGVSTVSPSRPVPKGRGRRQISSSHQGDAPENRPTDDGPTIELLTAWARPLPGVDLAVEAEAFRATNTDRWHELRDVRRAWAGWLAKAAERNRPTPTPGTPECPLHPGRPTGSKACPECATENTPTPGLRALRGAS